MTNTQLANSLEQKLNATGATNHTIRYIIKFLRAGNSNAAHAEYRNDGDKIPRYEGWGKEVDNLLHDHLGCRTHRVLQCKTAFCGMRT